MLKLLILQKYWQVELRKKTKDKSITSSFAITFQPKVEINNPKAKKIFESAVMSYDRSDTSNAYDKFNKIVQDAEIKNTLRQKEKVIIYSNVVNCLLELERYEDANDILENKKYNICVA